MKRVRAEDLTFPPMPGVAGVMEAVCGYARMEGFHRCGIERGGCQATSWQRVRNRVITLVWAALEDVRDADDPKTEAQSLIDGLLENWQPGQDDEPDGPHRDKRWFEVLLASMQEGDAL